SLHARDSGGDSGANLLVLLKLIEIQRTVGQQTFAEVAQDINLGANVAQSMNATVTHAYIIEHGLLGGGLSFFIARRDRQNQCLTGLYTGDVSAIQCGGHESFKTDAIQCGAGPAAVGRSGEKVTAHE